MLLLDSGAQYADGTTDVTRVSVADPGNHGRPPEMSIGTPWHISVCMSPGTLKFGMPTHEERKLVALEPFTTDSARPELH